MRKQGDEWVSPRRSRASHKEDHYGAPHALKVILGALKPKCQESADLRRCADAVLKKIKLRDMGEDGGCEAGEDLKALALQNEQRFAEMERVHREQTREAGLRVQDLEEQAVKMRQQGASMVQ